MFRKLITISLAISIAAYPLLAARAATIPLSQAAGALVPPAQDALSAEQIDNLLAPIALYPDPLLAQMLPASTFVDQIDQAARYLRANKNQSTGVDNQSWDVSVKSIAHYPEVVFKMSESLDWTTALGQAYVSQSADVLDSIQRLRDRAKDAGNLKTTPQQTVIVEKEVIKIVPAQPQYIYVPTYNPQVVYVKPGPSTGTVVATAAIAFTTGLIIGAWLNNDCDWYGHRVYYHGWRGSGWIGYSSVHVHVRNSYYVNSRHTNINVNRAVINRNVNYNNIHRYNSVSRNVNYNKIRVNNVNRNNVNVNNINRNNVNNRNLNRNINTGNRNSDSYRGRTNTPVARPSTQPANRQAAQTRNSAFGRPASGPQTRAQSDRGRQSRASSPAVSRPDAKSGGRTRGGGNRK